MCAEPTCGSINCGCKLCSSRQQRHGATSQSTYLAPSLRSPRRIDNHATSANTAECAVIFQDACGSQLSLHNYAQFSFSTGTLIRSSSKTQSHIHWVPWTNVFTLSDPVCDFPQTCATVTPERRVRVELCCWIQTIGLLRLKQYCWLSNVDLKVFIFQKLFLSAVGLNWK